MPDITIDDKASVALDEEQQAISLDEGDWDNLLENIEAGSCTPFLGAGACVPLLPSASQLAKEWAEKYGYPLEDCGDLSRVAQFLATTRSNTFPKRSEEHTSELQSPMYLVCRLLLEKKKKQTTNHIRITQ